MLFTLSIIQIFFPLLKCNTIRKWHKPVEALGYDLTPVSELPREGLI